MEWLIYFSIGVGFFIVFKIIDFISKKLGIGIRTFFQNLKDELNKLFKSIRKFAKEKKLIPNTIRVVFIIFLFWYAGEVGGNFYSFLDFYIIHIFVTKKIVTQFKENVKRAWVQCLQNQVYIICSNILKTV